MEFGVIVELISTVGFPIALVIVLGVFIFKIYTDQQKARVEAQEQNEKNMAAVQARCKEREEKLYEEIKANREVNAQAIATISMYAESLKSMKQDINEIKTDIAIITNKIQ